MFKEQLVTLVTAALEDVETAKSQGRVANNAKSEAHFLSLWVTQAIKQKRFSASMAPLLKNWQQQARTLGQGANLKQEFSHIKLCYQQACERFNDDKVLQLIDSLDDSWQVGWRANIGKKESLKLNRASSLVVNQDEFDAVFETQQTQQFSIFLRGQQQEFIEMALGLGILCFKVSDYKSPIKFHGQFIIDTKNNYSAIPQFFNAALDR